MNYVINHSFELSIVLLNRLYTLSFFLRHTHKYAVYKWQLTHFSLVRGRFL